MKNNYLNNISVIVIVYFFITTFLTAQSLEWQGQVSSWLTINPDPKFEGQLGIRYIPTISVRKQINTYLLDGEIAGNMYGTANHYSDLDDDTDGKIKPYRLWLRFSTNQFELRAGLQKINFGSATLLRPLMWFDRIDPRDPLQLTDGVYGLLGRYYFLNNANIWLWVLYGNNETKGWEFIPSTKNKPEFGGRIQVPLWTGEIALTGHHRTADIEENDNNLVNDNKSVSENRLAMDGKWDVGVGIWFESAVSHTNYDEQSLRYARMINLGLDYTFNLGNGLHTLVEYLRVDASGELFKSGRPSSLAALSINYPFGLLDSFGAMLYYDWTNENAYRFMNWQRTYDQWSFYVMGFWNPSEFRIYQNQDEQNLFAGKGVQFMVVFNH